MDKGIIIGAEGECVLRSTLPFALFRWNTNVRELPHAILLLISFSLIFS
jgi:hypothetical protein